MPTVSVRRIVAAPPEKVWAAIADIEGAAHWNQAWQRIEFLTRQREGAGTAFRAYAEDGRVAEFEVVAWEPPQFIAFAPRQTPREGKAPSGDDLITLESHAFYLEPVGEGQTELHLMATATTRGLRGWLLGRLLWPGYQKQGMRQAIDAVAALLEGET